ncbi:MAG: hypothetical protein MJ033_08185 [Victivallaceae bacterium]|nr:hypothetical protein [Victivallaceae bacterium]
MIDETFCNALLTRSSGASFTWQINAGYANTMTSRLARRMIAAEQALPGVALLIADLAGIDCLNDFFCGELPTSANEGFAVSFLGSGKRENYDATPFHFLLYGRGRNLDTFSRVAGNLAAKLPLPLAVSVSHSSTDTIVVRQMICGKTQIESVGGKGCAPYMLKMELTADVNSAF